MTSGKFTESEVEELALNLLGTLGYEIEHGPEIAPGEADAERESYDQVVLEARLRASIEKLNPGLPIEAIDDAFRRVMRAAGSTLEARNRSVCKMRVEGVTVEYRRDDGSIAGAQATLIDFDKPQRLGYTEITWPRRRSRHRRHRRQVDSGQRRVLGRL